MSGNHRRDSHDPEAGVPDWLARWSERKRARAPHDDARAPPAARSVAPRPGKAGGEKVLTDQDMPPLESLDGESDYSAFLSPGVSDALQRLALRKLFGAAKFHVRDGLDDYDTDYNLLTPLRRVLDGVTQDELAEQLQRAAEGQTAQAEDTGHPAVEAPAPPATEPADPGPVPPEGPVERDRT